MQLNVWARPAFFFGASHLAKVANSLQKRSDSHTRAARDALRAAPKQLERTAMSRAEYPFH